MPEAIDRSSAFNDNRKQATDEIIVSLVDGLDDFAIIALDRSGVILSWNAGAEEMFGYTQSERVGCQFSSLFDDSDRSRGLPQTHLAEATEQQELKSECWLVRKNGKLFRARIAIKKIFKAPGISSGYAVVVNDLGERSQVQERLRRVQEAFDVMVSAVKDYAIFLIDAQGNILTWNQGAQRIKGYSAEEIIGRNFETFYTAEDKEREHPQYELREALRNGHYEEESWRVRKDGTRFWASVTITPVTDENGEARGFIKVTRDLSERKRNEERLRQARDEAVIANRLKSQFVANVSHEVRTPLAGILGMGELLLLDEDLSEDQRAAVDRIFKSSLRLLEVINDLLDFSKLEAGRVTIETSEFTVSGLVRDVAESVSALTQKKQLELIVEVSNDETKYFADEGKIRQLLLNLVNNAIKFTDKGSIKIRASIEHPLDNSDAVLKLSVQDTGIGISEEGLSQLFLPFVQAEIGAKRKYAGTGLGLSIAKRYAELMGGSISAESVLGQGSIFTVTIPVKKAFND